MITIPKNLYYDEEIELRDYELVLESFNRFQDERKTLKTEIITITVAERTVQTLTPLVPLSWKFPGLSEAEL